VVEPGTVTVKVAVDVVEVTVTTSVVMVSMYVSQFKKLLYLMYEPVTVAVVTVSVSVATTVGSVNVPKKLVNQVLHFSCRNPERTFNCGDSCDGGCECYSSCTSRGDCI